MNEYILTDGGYILSRIILCMFALIHFTGAYIFALFRVHISPKVFHSFFIVEFVALTAFVIWGWNNEPFVDGMLMAIIGYLIIYSVFIFSWFVLLRVTISQTKVYQMVPCHRGLGKIGEKAVEGYIIGEIRNYRVVVYNDELYDNIKNYPSVNVRFKSYPELQIGFNNIEAVMEIVQ